MKLDRAIDYFMTALETEQLSSHSLRAYKQDLNQFYLTLNKTLLDELSYEDFQDYFVSIIYLKIASVKRKRAVLHRFLKFCYQKKFCKQRLYEYIDPIKSKKTNTPKEVLSKEEINQLFLFFSEQKEKYLLKIEEPYYEYLYYCCVRNTMLIHILLYTGCRAQEAVALKKSDILLSYNTITLFTKGKKYNQVPIHDELLKAFQTYEAAISLIKGKELITLLQSHYLFPSKLDNTKHLATRSLHDLMHTLSEVINRHLHAHLFRHTFVSYCIAANMDISTLSSLISHSNPSITLAIYTHEIDAHNKQIQIKKLSFT